MDLLYSVASGQNREKERNEHKDDAGIGGVFAAGTRGRHGAIFLRKSCFCLRELLGLWYNTAEIKEGTQKMRELKRWLRKA